LGLPNGLLIFDFAFPDQMIAVDIVNDIVRYPDIMDKAERAKAEGWTFCTLTTSDVFNLNGLREKLYGQLVELLVRPVTKKYLCEFVAGWNEDGNDYKIVEARNWHDLQTKLTKMLAERGIGDPDSYPNTRKANELRFTTVYAYEIANTHSFGVNDYVGKMEDQERTAFETLRAKYESKEEELRLYDRLKRRYGTQDTPVIDDEDDDFEWA
jgi:hypothetical protein